MAFDPDEPRDAHGRWTDSGTVPINIGRRRKPLFDKSREGRAHALIMHALLAAPPKFRRAPDWATPSWGDRFEDLITRWNDAATLTDPAFRDRLLGTGASLATVRDLRMAALGAAIAHNSDDVADAATHLAAAMRAIGADNWSNFIRAAAGRADGGLDDGVFRPGIDAGGLIDAQAVEGSEGSGEDDESSRRDGLLEELIDPAAELRVTSYNRIFTDLQRLNGGVSGPVMSAPRFVPSQAQIDTLSGILARRQEQVATSIGRGHAFDEHVIAEGEFPGISRRQQFENLVLSVVRSRNVHVCDLSDGRTAFYDERTNTLVIVDPRNRDLGSAYKPSGRLDYFLNKLY